MQNETPTVRLIPILRLGTISDQTSRIGLFKSGARTTCLFVRRVELIFWENLASTQNVPLVARNMNYGDTQPPMSRTESRAGARYSVGYLER